MSARDAFAVSADMLSVAEALERILAGVTPLATTETVPLLEAYGRVLAEDILSDRAVPPHDNSAVDGYAVHHADLSAEAPVRLPVTRRIAAGDPPGPALPRGEAARIFTGAPVPPGADTVIPQEPCEAGGDGDVLLPAVRKAGGNLRRAGEDVAVGQTLLTAGHRLRPQDVGYIGSVGVGRPRVYGRLRVGVFSTGSEVRDPGTAAPPGAIYDSNRYVLIGLLRAMGCAVSDLGILPDDRAMLTARLADAGAAQDALVTSGGVSTGEEDHVKAAVEANGHLDFWRVAIRPGRPLAMGRVGNAHFIGLPGNPVASLVCFLIFGRPLLMKRMGMTALAPRRLPVRAAFATRKRAGRTEWMRGWLRRGEDGGLWVDRYPREGSGILTSVVVCDGLIELPAEAEAVAEGDVLDFLPFDSLMA